MNTINKTARMAGFLYLIYMVTHIISDVWRGSFIVLGDAAETVSNIWLMKGYSLSLLWVIYSLLRFSF